jgi:hypothetical protein
MLSQFEVRDYYEFDILRNAPVTIDPYGWDHFNSSIKEISYVDVLFLNYQDNTI